MNDKIKEVEDEKSLDELLNEFLLRNYQLKKKAQEIQNDKSLTTRIIRWMSSSTK